MEKMTLRRIGWIGATMGLTTALVGCGDMQSDADSTATGGGSTTSSGYLNSDNGLSAINGLSAVNGLSAINGLSAVNGLSSVNGLSAVNGLSSVNGWNGAHGFNSTAGSKQINGVDTVNGLSSINGLSSVNGLMTTDSGRMTASYIVKCALAAGDSLVKQDQSGNNFTFKGSLGLAPQYKTGACDKTCAEALSSCLMAHINTSGVHIPLWMTSPLAPIGWGQSPSFPTQEGTFFGQIMATNTANNLDAYFCNGPDVGADTVPGRLGQSAGAPYANAYPTTGGLCNAAGHCAMNADGATSCVGNSITWASPITVWRGKTFQAESATLSGAAQVINQSTNSNGKRVGYLSSTSSVKFTGVPSATVGSNNLVIYYANGDDHGLRYFNVKVNGGAAQSKGFKFLNDWSKIGQATVTLTGFNANSTNTVEFMGDGSNNVPDLDWIEVIGASANFCDHSRWSVSASNSGSSDPALNAVDGYDTSRWTSGRDQDGTDWFKVDFGGMVTMSNMTLTNGGYDPNDYPGSVSLYGSTDGVNFSSSSFATKSGSPDQTVITFPTQTLRAVKIMQKGTANSSHYWSIHEFDTDCAVAASQTAPGTCDRSQWVESASANSAEDDIGNDGNLGTRWTTNRTMATGDYFQLDFTGTVKLTSITLNNTQTSSNDYPGAIALFGSADGVTFDTTAFATANGAANSTVVNFAQRSLKAVRVKVTTARSNYWSIGEMQAACSL